MRGVIVALMLVAGVSMAVTSYFFLTAPLGPPIGSIYSSPRLIGAPAIFVGGVITVFLSAVVYELLPERRSIER